jgi:hypothetical protein
MQIAGANEELLSGGSPGSADKLAPPPEIPDPQALRTPPPPPPAAPLPTVVAVTPAMPAPAVAQAVPRPAVAQTALKPAETPEKRPAAAVAAAAPRAVPAGRETLVQFAAVRTEDAAREEWDRLTHRMPDLLKTRRPSISKVDRDGHAIWRVRTGGFSDASEATVFCQRVRAKGAGCAVADF